MPATSFRNTSRSKGGPAAAGGASEDIETPKQVALGVTTVQDYEALQRLVEEREALLNINRTIGRHLKPRRTFRSTGICL